MMEVSHNVNKLCAGINTHKWQEQDDKDTQQRLNDRSRKVKSHQFLMKCTLVLS